MDGTFVSAVLLLLLVCDPFGNIPIFIAALRDVPRERRRMIILRECVIACTVLTLFAFSCCWCRAARRSRWSGCWRSPW